MSDFILRRHYPVKVDYWASEHEVVQPANLDVKYTIGVGHNKTNPLDWRVQLTVVFSARHQNEDTIKGTVVFVGYFLLPDVIPEADRTNFAARNGASVLYSATRELVAYISCRSANRNITLPLAVFNEVKIDPKDVTGEVEVQV